MLSTVMIPSNLFNLKFPLYVCHYDNRERKYFESEVGYPTMHKVEALNKYKFG